MKLLLKTDPGNADNIWFELEYETPTGIKTTQSEWMSKSDMRFVAYAQENMARVVKELGAKLIRELLKEQDTAAFTKWMS